MLHVYNMSRVFATAKVFETLYMVMSKSMYLYTFPVCAKNVLKVHFIVKCICVSLLLYSYIYGFVIGVSRNRLKCICIPMCVYFPLFSAF